MTRLKRMMPLLLVGAAMALVPAAAEAQPERSYAFDLPTQDLGDALRAVGAKAGWEVYAPAAAVNGRKAPAVKVRLTPREAIERLLAGSGLTAHFGEGAVVIRGRSDDSAAADEAANPETQIVVTGTRIPGAAASSEVIPVTRRAIELAGQVDLGEAVRAIPQNFGGGQNPGVGAGAGLINSNVNSAASVNLRGLGPDATLTLLNGHRLPYDSAFGGVDISAIPVGAIDRIEVVPDGASAIYGSDAVAGVVNVILRHDFEGVETSAQLGGSTDGGNLRKQVDVVTGTGWEGGGFVLAYDFSANTGIRAGQRDYAGLLDPANTLYPEQRRHALTLSAHQDLGSGVTFSIDALYDKRWSTIVGGTSDYRLVTTPRVETWSVAPELRAALGGDWAVTLAGALGDDRTHYDGTAAPAGSAASETSGCICNRAVSAELSAEGPLFALPGGAARLALGGGYRDNRLTYTRVTDGVVGTDFDVGQHSTYAFGEVSLPLVGPEQHVAGIDRLTLSGALRYEDYPGMARLATPRIGLVYAPVHDLTFRASWARSFKAPTLYQKYVGYQAYLLPAAAYGVGSAGQTVLFAGGGNPDLTPETARSWSAGFTYAPAGAHGLQIEATWFDVNYRNRVAEPIPGSIAAAFRDPAYATLIGYSPDAATLAALVAGAQYGLQNYSGGSYNPAAVYALVDDRNRNVAAQAIHGIDAHLAWPFAFGGGRSLTFDLAGTWLESSQRIAPTLPATPLAGVVFNPPHLRGRAGLTYAAPRTTLSAFVNYTGALTDNRFDLPVSIAPQATLDLAVRYVVIGGPQDAPALAVSLVVNNVFNAAPRAIGQTGPTDTPYDSTNYSPIGRFIALGLTRHW